MTECSISEKALRTLLLAALTLAGCATTDLTPIGKTRISFQPEADERRLWARSEEEQRKLDSSGLLYQDAELETYLNDVLDRLVPPEIKNETFRITVRVLRNPLLNAFTYPNGVIYVHTGILARMDNEAQLATLLGHELTHATHRHGIVRFRDVQNKAAFLATFQVMTGPFGLIGALAQVIGTVGTIAAVYGYSQDQEREADREGLSLVIYAGYDPREAPKLFGHLKEWVADQKKPEPFFFGTHPRLDERIDNFNRLLADEFKDAVARGGRVEESEFLTRSRTIILENSVLDLQAGRFLQAQKGLTKFLALSPDDPRAHYYLAESYRRKNDPKERDLAIENYQKAMALDSTFADPHRGLGSLYYQEGKRAEAREAFQHYLSLAPAAADRPFIEGVVKELAGSEQRQ